MVLNFQTALHFRILGANVAERWWCCYWSRTSADARSKCIDVHDLESFAWECELRLHWRSSPWRLECSGYSGQSAAMLFVVKEVDRKLTSPLQSHYAGGPSSSSSMGVSHQGRALHDDGEIPPLPPAWRRFLQAAVERKFLRPYHLKPESFDIAVVSR